MHEFEGVVKGDDAGAGEASKLRKHNDSDAILLASDLRIQSKGGSGRAQSAIE